MQSELVEIRTHETTYVVSADMNVSVVVGLGKYVVKRARDVLPGDRVLQRVDVNRRTIDDLEAYMELHPDYVLARDTVIVEAKDGSRTPKFRVDLISDLSGGSLEARLRETTRLSNSEVDLFVGELREKKIKEPTARNWVLGNVVVPRIENLELIAGVGPKMQDLYTSMCARDSFAKAYVYWRVARSGLMKLLGNGASSQKTDKWDTTDAAASDGLNLAQMPVVQGVINLLEKEGALDSRFGFGKVVQRRSVKKGKNGLKVVMGVREIAGEVPESLGFERVSMQRLFLDYKVLNCALGEVLQTELEINLPELSSHLLSYNLFIYLIQRSGVYDLDPYMKESLRQISENDKPGVKEASHQLNNLANKLYGEMHDGALDERNGLEVGTVKKLVESVMTITKAFPALYYRHPIAVRKNKVDVQFRGKLDGEIRELERRLKEEYGIDFYEKALPSTDFANCFGYDRSPKEIREALGRNIDQVVVTYSDCGSFFSERDVDEILGRYGLMNAKKFVPSINYRIANRAALLAMIANDPSTGLS